MVLDPTRRQTNLYGAANVQVQIVTTAFGGSTLNTDMLNNFMLNQSPTTVTSNRIRVQIDSTYHDVAQLRFDSERQLEKLDTGKRMVKKRKHGPVHLRPLGLHHPEHEG